MGSYFQGPAIVPDEGRDNTQTQHPSHHSQQHHSKDQLDAGALFVLQSKGISLLSLSLLFILVSLFM